MSDAEIVKLLTGFISGILLSFLSQILTSFVIKPNQDVNSIVSKISSDLLFYLNRLTNPDLLGTQKAIDISEEFRGHETVLRAFAAQLVWKPCKPRKSDLYEASKSLMGLSNNLVGPAVDWNEGHVKSRLDNLKTHLSLPENFLQ